MTQRVNTNNDTIIGNRFGRIVVIHDCMRFEISVDKLVEVGLWLISWHKETRFGIHRFDTSSTT